MRVAVIGLGYVGLVTGVGLAAMGHDVVGVERDAAKAEAIGLGRVPFHEPGLDALLAEVLASGRFRATTDLASALAGTEVSLIAVGTPEGPAGIDLSQVEAAAEAIGRAAVDLAANHVVVVKSTVVPGTTDTVVARGLARGAGGEMPAVGLAMNPEFLREGTALADFMAPDRIVVGASDEASGDRIAALYAGFDAPLLRTSLRDAEAIKYATNALLAVMVSYANELAAICEATPGTDIDVVMRGLHLDRRLTSQGSGGGRTAEIATYLRPGLGYGGSCLPKDVAALRAFAAQAGPGSPLLDAAAQVNLDRPRRVLRLLEEALGGLPGARVAVLGLAFKPGTTDVRSSAGLAFIEALLAGAADVRAHDPLVGPEHVTLDTRVTLASSASAAIADADAVVLATAWPEYQALDWPVLVGRMRRPIVLDGRNALRGVVWPSHATYLCLGRRPEAPQPQELPT